MLPIENDNCLFNYFQGKVLNSSLFNWLNLVLTFLTGFALGMGVGVATGVVSTLMFIGIIQIIKSRLQASKLGSPRVRNVLPLQTPTSFGGKTPTGNGHLPNGHILRNGDIPGSQRFSVTSSISSSGNSSRNGRTPSTGHSSPNHSDTQNKNNNNYKRNGVLPTNIGHV